MASSVSPDSTRTDLVPASSAMRMSVLSLSPIMTTSSAGTPISAPAISSMSLLGFPTTVGATCARSSYRRMNGPMSTS